MRVAFLLMVFLMLGSVAVSGQQIQGVTLAKEGVSQAVVVVAPDATEPERHAAGELAYFLEQVTGAKFEIVPASPDGKYRILVGPGAGRLADKNFSTDDLGTDGIVIRTVGNDLLLAGGSPRGTLYAVYTFLEDYVGCRWWAPGESTIPHKPTLVTTRTMNVRYVPVMEYREPYQAFHLADGDWYVRNKIYAFGGMGGAPHTFYTDIPPAKYFTAHPDWFSEINGHRMSANAQLCMTNLELIQEYAQVLKEKFRTQPGLNLIWVSQNDWGGYCECKKCKAINDREGTPAGSLIYFINLIAAELEKEFPKVAVRTLAYDWSQTPPKTIRPRVNVVIELCTTGTKYNVPLTHEINRSFREALDGWSKVCNRIWIWDYVTNFSAYLCPHPNLRTLGPNARYFADHHVKGVFYQGGYHAPGSEMAELRAWVETKLLWNPYQDGQNLIDEFLNGYYGPAGKHIKTYLDVFHDAIARTGESIYMQEQPVGKKWLTLKTLCEGMGHMQKAKASATGNEDLVRRVEIAELPLLYVFLLRWDELYEQAKTQKVAWPFEGIEIQEVFDRFQAVRKENGITQLSEENARDFFGTVTERLAVGKSLVPPGCENLPRDRWVDLQDVGFVRDTAVVSRVDDETASDGSALFIPPGCTGEKRLLWKELWRVPLVSAAAESKRPLRVFLSVRCDLASRDGSIFKCGILDNDAKMLNRIDNRVLEIKAADVPDDCYHTYELGIFENLAGGWITVWIAPANNPDNVKKIWVDRIWLVQEE